MNEELSLNCLSYTQTTGSLSDMSQVESCHGDMFCIQPGMGYDVTFVVTGGSQLIQLSPRRVLHNAVSHC